MLAEVGVLPETEGASTNEGECLEETHFLVEGNLVSLTDEGDLPGLETEGHHEEGVDLAAVRLVGVILAPVLVLGRIVRRVVVPKVVHVFH